MILKFMLFILLNNQSCFADSSNAKACEIVVKNLTIVKNYLDKKDIDSSGRRVGAISFLEKLTSIQSESEGNLFGKFKPTYSDYDKWAYWYALNSKYLSFDEASGTILIYKRVEFPKW